MLVIRHGAIIAVLGATAALGALPTDAAARQPPAERIDTRTSRAGVPPDDLDFVLKAAMSVWRRWRSASWPGGRLGAGR
jgi:hypothetical protein